MSLSKTWISSSGRPLTMKLAPVGGGSPGTVEEGKRRCFTDDPLLPGGFDETSEGSGTDTESILFLRLDEEKFFLRLLGPVEPFTLNRPGESGTDGTLSKLSFEVTFVSAGVAGTVLGVPSPSAGLGVGCGEEPFLLSISLVLNVWVLESISNDASCDCTVANAD